MEGLAPIFSTPTAADVCLGTRVLIASWRWTSVGAPRVLTVVSALMLLIISRANASVDLKGFAVKQVRQFNNQY